MYRTLSGVALWLALSMPGWATDWVPLGEGGDGLFRIYVDRDSLQHTGTQAQAVEKHVYRQPVKLTGGRLIQAITAITARTAYDCARSSKLVLQGAAFSDTAATVAIDTLQRSDRPSSYTQVVPHSFEETVFKAVCPSGSGYLLQTAQE
jgi:hypothetical protein